MPPKRIYGPSTRKSQRLTGTSEEPGNKANDEAKVELDPSEVVTEDQEELRQNALIQSIEDESAEEYQSATDNDDNLATSKLPNTYTPIVSTPSSSTMPNGNDNEDNQLNELLKRIAQLERGTRPNRGARDVTPMNSAFGGKEFKPTGFAALPAFTPYGEDQNAENPDYDKKTRKTGIDPGLFKGDKEVFDKWIIKLADKCEEDNETFKKERSRMALINSLTEGNANDLLEGRYCSTEMPFKNAAEMVATLSAVFHDDNQGSKAREELRKLKYNPRARAVT